MDCELCNGAPPLPDRTEDCNGITSGDCNGNTLLQHVCPLTCGGMCFASTTTTATTTTAWCNGKPDPAECGSTFNFADCARSNFVGKQAKLLCPAMCGTCITTTTTATATTTTTACWDPNYIGSDPCTSTTTTITATTTTTVTSTTSTTTTTTLSIYVYVGAGGGSSLLLLLIIGIICFCRKQAKKKLMSKFNVNSDNDFDGIVDDENADDVQLLNLDPGPTSSAEDTCFKLGIDRKYWVSANQRGMDTEKLFIVSPSSAEFRAVANQFSATLQSKTIDRIERIENGVLQESFSLAAGSIRKQLSGSGQPSLQMVRSLFHGTPAVNMIVNSTDGNGFLPMLAGTAVGAIWGDGTYFARDAKYSDSYALNLPSGQRQMFLVDVVVGRSTQGAKGMKECPLVSGEKFTRFNSLVNNKRDPSIFIVQHSNQAYPKYLITYH